MNTYTITQINTNTGRQTWIANTHNKKTAVKTAKKESGKGFSSEVFMSGTGITTHCIFQGKAK